MQLTEAFALIPTLARSLIITHKSGMPSRAIPKELCPPAQGCEPVHPPQYCYARRASYPGKSSKPCFNPKRVVAAPALECNPGLCCGIPLGFGGFLTLDVGDDQPPGDGEPFGCACAP